MHNMTQQTIAPTTTTLIGHDTMTFEQKKAAGHARHTLKKTFGAYVKAPENRPWYSEEYGTKYPGKVTLLHFMIYAVLRGKDPRKVSHDPSGATYQHAWMMLTSPHYASERQSILRLAFGGLASDSELFDHLVKLPAEYKRSR